MGIIKNLLDNQKPREKAFLFGVESLSNSELIAVLLCTGSKNQDVIELANNLLNECGSLNNLRKLSLQELSLNKGIKKAKALKIKAALELHNRIIEERKYIKTKLLNITEVAVYINCLTYDRSQENLIILLLDQKNNVISSKILNKGTDGMVPTSAHQILTYAIKGCAKKFVIAHNHPSNNCYPSKNDEETTSALYLTSSLVGVELIDHLIITDDKFYSIIEKCEHKFD